MSGRADASHPEHRTSLSSCLFLHSLHGVRKTRATNLCRHPYAHQPHSVAQDRRVSLSGFHLRCPGDAFCAGTRCGGPRISRLTHPSADAHAFVRLLGLHRKCQASWGISKFEAEIRRRIWWSLALTDKVSTKTGVYQMEFADSAHSHHRSSTLSCMGGLISSSHSTVM